MVAIEPPWLLVLTWKDGRKRLLVEGERTEGTSLQFWHVLRADLQNLELVDAAGNYFAHVQGAVTGIDWETYRHGGLFAPVVFLIQLVFLNPMVRIQLQSADPPTALSLPEIRAKVTQAILGNERAYTHAPPQEIVQRVRAARTPASLIRSIFRD